ncbi:MAG: hypothetical protein MZU84_04440 [Sphingobacterium sp.]|nr:hypothetical protein [Sphingobacterium sp.]
MSETRRRASAGRILAGHRRPDAVGDLADPRHRRGHEGGVGAAHQEGAGAARARRSSTCSTSRRRARGRRSRSPRSA